MNPYKVVQGREENVDYRTTRIDDGLTTWHAIL